MKKKLSADISIFPGDPDKGNDGFMYAIRVGGLYRKSLGTFQQRGGAALAAAEHIDTLEKLIAHRRRDEEREEKNVDVGNE